MGAREELIRRLAEQATTGIVPSVDAASPYAMADDMSFSADEIDYVNEGEPQLTMLPEVAIAASPNRPLDRPPRPPTELLGMERGPGLTGPQPEQAPQQRTGAIARAAQEAAAPAVPGDDPLASARSAASRNKAIAGIGGIVNAIFGDRSQQGLARMAALQDQAADPLRRRRAQLAQQAAQERAAQQRMAELGVVQQGRETLQSRELGARDQAAAAKAEQQRVAAMSAAERQRYEDERRERERAEDRAEAERMARLRGDESIRVGTELAPLRRRTAAAHGIGARGLRQLEGEGPVGPPRTPTEGARSALMGQVNEIDWQDTPQDDATRAEMTTIARLYDQAASRRDREAQNDLQTEFRELARNVRERRGTEREHAVPGWQRRPDAPNLEASERNEIRSILASQRSLGESASALERLAGEMTAADFAQAQAGIITDRMAQAMHHQERASNATRILGQYGVPQAAELRRVETMLPRLDSWRGFVSGATLYRTLPGVADQVARAQMSQYGYEPQGEGRPRGRQGAGRRRQREQGAQPTQVRIGGQVHPVTDWATFEREAQRRGIEWEPVD